MKTINLETIKATVDSISNVLFAHAMETSNLNSFIRKESKLLENDKKTLEEMSDYVEIAELTQTIDAREKAIKKAQFQRTSVNAWKRVSLFGDKKTGDLGLYNELGIKEELYDTYTSAVSSRDFSAWNDAIADICEEWGFTLSGKLNKKFASTLSHTVGLKVASIKEIKKGGRVTKEESGNKFVELFSLSIRDYMVDTKQIDTPNDTLNTVSFEYNDKGVVSYSIIDVDNATVEKEEEEKVVTSTETETETETTEKVGGITKLKEEPAPVETVDSSDMLEVCNSMSVKSLKEECKKLGIKGYSKLPKTELVLLVANSCK